MAKAVEKAKCVIMCVTEKYRQRINCQVFEFFNYFFNFYNIENFNPNSVVTNYFIVSSTFL